jgi:predicted amidohydrolase
MKIEAVALQLEAQVGQVERNLEHFTAAAQALTGDVDLIVAPETFNTGYDLKRLRPRLPELAEPLDGPTVAAASAVAVDREATVVIGLLERGDGDTLHDTAVVVRADGTVHPYRKTHLYPPELELFAAGDQLTTVPNGPYRLGVMICFEHAFPEIATRLALDGAQILAIPSAVPVGYEYLVTLRTRARAQDNQLFAVAANLTGGGFCGHSLIVDPRGETLAEAGAEETALRATLTLEEIDEERRREPALRMRRPELYR